MSVRDLGSLSVSVLGPMEIRLNGELIPPPAPQQRRVLALLASRPGQTVSREWISQSIWGSAVPAQMRGMQVYVSNLRALLGRDSIELVGNGYRLNIKPEAVDENRFREHATRGQGALSAEDYVRARSEFETALSLWRGDPYDDVDNADFHARRVGLVEARLGAEDGLVRSKLEMVRQTNDAEALLPELTRLHAQEPRRQSRTLTYMRCLAAASRLSDVVAVANGYRALLRNEAGVEADGDFADLFSAIMQRDRRVLPRAWRSVVEGPQVASPVIGRDIERQVITGYLASPSTRLLSVTGPDGVGKTHLTAAVIREVADDFPGGVLWLQETEVETPEVAVENLASRLGVRRTTGDARRTLLTRLAARRTLVVVEAARASQLRAFFALLLAATPTVTVVISEAGTGLASENRVEVHPFAVSGPDGVSPAASFVSELASHWLGQPVHAESVQFLVAESDGLPSALAQVALDVISSRHAG